MGPIISIIVPIYNCEQYIERCINSILRQSFKFFELILLNDGSTDKSFDICKYYESKDSRIRVYSHSNMGVSRTRRKGLRLACGSYIAFVDSDDMICFDYLETLYKAIIAEDVNVVCCNSIDSYPISKDIFIEENELVTQNSKLVRAYFENKRYAYCIWGKLFKRDDLINIKFPSIKYSEDAYVVQTVFSNALGVKLIKYSGYYYTDNPNGAMSKAIGLQQPLDSLKCTLYISNICIEKYPDLIDLAKNRLIIESFSVLINSSIESLHIRRSIYDLLNNSIDMIGEDILKASKKGKILIAYKKAPKIINRLLKNYYIVKHRILRR